ncbi:hypothetical protein Ciccas_010392 [Cichlidogyrus casuarinus]|uniref:Uncharacterized protein n=1 Tax=Cichlidogyrus casuarinus TaxID=1844966 RepID=A0ABD2PUT9_9PLAT
MADICSCCGGERVEMLSRQGFTSGIHYELMTLEKETAFTGRKKYCCYRFLSSFVPKAVVNDEYDYYLEAHEIRLKKIHDCYGLALKDREMNFEINNVDLANEGLNKAYLVLDQLLEDIHFDRVFESILEVLRFIFSLMICLIYNQECLALSNSQLNREHAKCFENLKILDSQSKSLLEKLTNCKWKNADRIEWLHLVWFVNNLLQAFKNPKVFPGFFKHLIDIQFNKLAGTWNHLDDVDVVQLKHHPKLGRVEFLDPFTDHAINSHFKSYLVSVDKTLDRKHF